MLPMLNHWVYLAILVVESEPGHQQKLKIKRPSGPLQQYKIQIPTWFMMVRRTLDRDSGVEVRVLLLGYQWINDYDYQADYRTDYQIPR